MAPFTSRTPSTATSGAGRAPSFGVPPAQSAPFAFLRAIRESGLPPGVVAEQAAGGVFCALEVRLPPAVAARFQAALPDELRDLFRRCAAEHDLRPEGYGREEFLRRVGEHLDVGPEDAEEATRAVLAGVRALFSRREGAAAIAKLLPADLAVLFDDDDDALAEAGASVPLGAP